MKSIVEVDVGVPRAELADLFADPANNTEWMDDIRRVEPLGGELGMAGSRYRLVPKAGKDAFVATVVARDLPNELQLRLDAPGVTVDATDRFVAQSSRVTKLISVEEFSFRGLFRRIFGILAQSRVRSAHRRHMEAFKDFAESADRRRRGSAT